MSIPGLLHVPTEEASDSSPPINLTSFSLKNFTVPGSHRRGKCRPVSEFDKMQFVGQGSYGTVYKVRDRKTNDIFALKRLNIPKDSSSLMPQNFLREITNLKLLKHDNIANLIYVAAGKSFESTYLILEFCDYVLSDVIDGVRKALLQHPQMKNILHQLFTGLDYIHKHCIFHRDLSPSNILFSDSGILKITDFGLSRKMSSGNVTPGVGIRCYQAPEILFGSVNYSSSVDIWATGCIFAEMILKDENDDNVKPLFDGKSDCEVIKKIIEFLGTPTESIWPGFSELPVPKKYDLYSKPYNRIRSTFGKESDETIQLLQDTLSYNPSVRPTAEKCLKHLYFTEFPLACSTEDLIRTLRSSKAI